MVSPMMSPRSSSLTNGQCLRTTSSVCGYVHATHGLTGKSEPHVSRRAPNAR